MLGLEPGSLLEEQPEPSLLSHLRECSCLALWFRKEMISGQVVVGGWGMGEFNVQKALDLGKMIGLESFLLLPTHMTLGAPLASLVTAFPSRP